jgi:hypothetical protein
MVTAAVTRLHPEQVLEAAGYAGWLNEDERVPRHRIRTAGPPAAWATSSKVRPTRASSATTSTARAITKHRPQGARLRPKGGMSALSTRSSRSGSSAASPKPAIGRRTTNRQPASRWQVACYAVLSAATRWSPTNAKATRRARESTPVSPAIERRERVLAAATALMWPTQGCWPRCAGCVVRHGHKRASNASWVQRARARPSV